METMTFTPGDLDVVRRQLAYCAGNALRDRLQRLRIAVWQMEVLSKKYQPLLANDRAVNDQEYGIDGRTDCVDNASNTTTFLHVLQDLGELPGWSILSPRVRNRFDWSLVHWTAVVLDRNTGTQWAVDSWFRPHGHLPMVLPLPDWIGEAVAWEPPFDEFNPYPRYSNELCATSARQSQ